MNFASDNCAGAAPEVMDALMRANDGLAPSYGADDITARASARISELFERDCAVYFVATGGAANGLALSVLARRFSMIVCHETAHVQMDECAGPEFFTGGAKLLPVPGAQGKLTPDGVRVALAGFPHRPPHGAPADVLTVTQATESGTTYSVKEVMALCDVAKEAGLSVHMDGARFANAVATTGASPADMTWRAGVDVLSFGGTKNGCIMAEAVVVFDPEKTGDIEMLRKRAGHLPSKMRFIAAQFEAYLTDNLWLRLASKANASAKKLATLLAAFDGVDVGYPTDINEVFVSLPADAADALLKAGAVFYPWTTPGDPPEKNLYRLITSYQTTDEEIDLFIATLKAALAQR